MPQLTIPQEVAALLPLLATMLSGFFSHDRLPRGVNALIALVALVATAVACLWLAGNFTGNAQASVLAVLGYVAILMNGDLHAIYLFLVTAPSPLAAMVSSPAAAHQGSASSRSQEPGGAAADPVSHGKPSSSSDDAWHLVRRTANDGR